ncbi:exported protein [Roseomonas fluvialis]|uniref:Exported protein n=2 Tax=Roseomonas fluvialis TaxID=1750527 RepID=A0ABM7XZM7_9PROT|nr:exported protein [Roseomonas fluvialis]
MNSIHRRSLAALALASLPAAAHAQPVPTLDLLIGRGGPAAGAGVLDEALCQALGQVRRGRVALRADGRAIPDTIAAPPDGSTLLLTDDIATFFRPTTRAILPDRMHDLVPVTMVFRFPSVLLAKVELGVSDLAALLRLAGREPDSVAVRVGPTLRSEGVAMALVESAAGVRFSLVDFGVRGRGSPPRWDLAVESPSAATPRPPGGPALRPIAVTTPRRVARLPTVPSFTELGQPGFEAIGWWGVFAPPGTTPETCDGLHRDIARACALPAVRQAVAGWYAETPVMPPAEFAALLAQERPRITALAPRLRRSMLG